MTGRLDGKVVFITGAGRGQGRNHAVRMAEQGADIIAVDICENIDTVSEFYPLATEEDLAETKRLVEATGRRVVAEKADVRDFDGLKAVLEAGVSTLGRLDCVVANAGIATYGKSWELSGDQWRDMIDVNLTGVWHSAKAAVPILLEQRQGGSMIFTSSIGGLKGVQHVAHYVAAKHALVGLMRTMANELSAEGVRFNTVHPTNVDTMMIQNPGTYSMFAPSDPNPTQEKAMPGFESLSNLPTPWIDCDDVTNAMIYLLSDEARYVTGVALPVDTGATIK